MSLVQHAKLELQIADLWRPRRDITAQFVRGHINIIQ